jgi:hypothetical protein
LVVVALVVPLMGILLLMVVEVVLVDSLQMKAVQQ